MLAAGIKSSARLTELESHLREDIGRRMKSGLNAQDAFETAVQEIGKADMLKNEFKKIGGPPGVLERLRIVIWNDAFDWKLMEISFGIMASVIPLFFCSTFLRFKYGSLVDLTPGQQISGVAAVILFALFAWSGRLGYKMFPVVQRMRTRSIITIFCVVPVMAWWLLFMNVIVPRHDYTLCQFTVAFLWGFAVPTGPMIGLVWGFEAAARKRMTARVS